MKKKKTVTQQLEAIENRILKTDSATALFDQLIDQRNQLLIRQYHGQH